MEYTHVGRLGLVVSRLCLGTMNFGPHSSEEDSHAIMDAAVARWPLAFVAASAWGYYALTDLFIVAAIIYDLASRRRVVGAYVWGGLLVVSAQLVRELVGPTSVWHALARRVIG